MANPQTPLQTGRVLCAVCRACHYTISAGSGPSWGKVSVPCRRCGATFAFCELVPDGSDQPWLWHVHEAALEHVGLMHYGPIEVRGAGELRPGPYWAISCHDASGLRQWLHFQKARPTVAGRAVVTWGGFSSLPMPWPGVSPDTYGCAVWGVLVIQRNRTVRRPWRRERLAVGALAIVPCPPR
jgi:hypothetical protein